jgi:hypothetical protein
MEDMALVNREEIRSAVDLPGAGVNDPDARVVFPTRFKNKELGPAVDVKIHKGISHGVQMACLSGKVEQKILILDEVRHAEFVPDVRNVDSNTAFIAPKIEEISSVLRNEAIYDRHSSPQIGQSPSQVASYEAHTSGDQNAFASEILEIRHS